MKFGLAFILLAVVAAPPAKALPTSDPCSLTFIGNEITVRDSDGGVVYKGTNCEDAANAYRAACMR